MMVGDGLFSVVASSATFFLAITAAFASVSGAADYQYRHTDGADLCPTELLACEQDATCFDCLTVQDRVGTELDECLTSPESSDLCLDAIIDFCCVDELSKYDCIGNDALLEFGKCSLLASGCSADDVSFLGHESLGETCGRWRDTGIGRSGMSSKSISGSSSSSTADSSTDAIVSLGVYDYHADIDDDNADDNDDGEVDDDDDTVFFSTDLCRAEEMACTSTAPCFSCNRAMQSTEFEQCEIAAAGGEFMSDVCAQARPTFRCVDELVEYDCMGDDVFVEYMTCELLASGCSVDDIFSEGHVSLGATRGGGGGGSNTAGLWVVVTVAFAFVLFAAGVGVGVMLSVKFVPESRSFSRII